MLVEYKGEAGDVLAFLGYRGYNKGVGPTCGERKIRSDARKFLNINS